MKIYLGSDHGGFELKHKIIEFLKNKNIEAEDVGCNSRERCDFPDYAEKVAKKVARNQNNKGILVCKTGIGMSIAANKVKGIRAALCCNEKMAKLSREHNDSNVLCLGAEVVDEESALKIVDAWLKTGFIGGRYLERNKKIEK